MSVINVFAAGPSEERTWVNDYGQWLHKHLQKDLPFCLLCRAYTSTSGDSYAYTSIRSRECTYSGILSLFPPAIREYTNATI